MVYVIQYLLRENVPQGVRAKKEGTGRQGGATVEVKS